MTNPLGYPVNWRRRLRFDAWMKTRTIAQLEDELRTKCSGSPWKAVVLRYTIQDRIIDEERARVARTNQAALLALVPTEE